MALPSSPAAQWQIVYCFFWLGGIAIAFGLRFLLCDGWHELIQICAPCYPFIPRLPVNHYPPLLTPIANITLPITSKNAFSSFFSNRIILQIACGQTKWLSWPNSTATRHQNLHFGVHGSPEVNICFFLKIADCTLRCVLVRKYLC